MIDIRPAHLDDAEVLAVLCLTVWTDTYCYEGIERSHAEYLLSQYTAETLTQTMLNRVVYVAVYEHRIVGVGILHSQSGEIETLYVLPRFKGMGAGRKLISELKRNTDQRLFLTCWEGNDAALSFYRALGFTDVGEAFFDLDGKQIRNVTLSSESEQ